MQIRRALPWKALRVGIAQTPIHFRVSCNRRELSAFRYQNRTLIRTTSNAIAQFFFFNLLVVEARTTRLLSTRTRLVFDFSGRLSKLSTIFPTRSPMTPLL